MYEDGVRQIWKKVLAAINSYAKHLLRCTTIEEFTLVAEAFIAAFL
jgi:hypothetical protein